jgi:hypothetical protein
MGHSAPARQRLARSTTRLATASLAKMYSMSTSSQLRKCTSGTRILEAGVRICGLDMVFVLLADLLDLVPSLPLLLMRDEPGL